MPKTLHTLAAVFYPLDKCDIVCYDTGVARDKSPMIFKNNPRGNWQISHIETLAELALTKLLRE